ncbi:hypothetical protein [Rosenbergiella collisarenosi]|uniref:hypothetical protein n=1 Tax=Rosenbergiella collisarenosi TaxID=1544695 RepID=UPI001F4D400D|nr:hypothetical protein [Rosenbergiella collisarenosi]
MGGIFKLIVKGIGFRGFILMALVAGTAYLSSQGLSKYHQLKKDLATYEQTTKNDAKEKDTLRQQVDAQKQRADAAEGNTKLLTDQMAQQQAEERRYQDQLKALQDKKDKEDAETQKTLQRLNHELSLAGVHNVRVPDSVIRMQQQAICRVNNTCASSDDHKDDHTTTNQH